MSQPDALTDARAAADRAWSHFTQLADDPSGADPAELRAALDAYHAAERDYTALRNATRDNPAV